MRLYDNATYKCDFCGCAEPRYDGDTIQSVEARLFRWGWVTIYKGDPSRPVPLHLCTSCVTISLYGKSLPLSAFTQRDAILEKLEKLKELRFK